MRFVNDDLRWGIIGCGAVCEVKSGPAFSKIKHSSLRAVMRRDAAKAADYAKRHNVPKFYTEARQLIDDPEINAIYIATPPAQHEALAIQAMEAGKPVYVEKPLALDAASAARMREASIRHQVPAVGAYYRRALPLFNHVKLLLRRKEIGKVKLIAITTLQSKTKNSIMQAQDNWRVNPALSGGGLFHDLAPHQLDLMCWLFGEPLWSNGKSFNQDKAGPAPDVTALDAVFPSDILLRGTWAFHVHESAARESCEIIGDQGKLVFSFFSGAALEIVKGADKRVVEFTNPETIQQPMIEKAAAYFRGEGDNPCSFEEALVSMKMLDSARQLADPKIDFTPQFC